MKLFVLAYLPKTLKARLHTSIHTRHRIQFGDCWPDITLALRQTHVDILIVDPDVENAPSTPIIARIMEEFPSVATILYGTLSPTTVKAVRDLSKRGLYEVVLAEYEDEPVRLRSLIESVPPKGLIPLLFFHLRSELNRLPPHIAERVRDVFETPSVVQSADELAVYTGLSRTLLYEMFGNLGLGSPKRLIIASRLLRAYVYLRDPGHAFRFVVRKVGYTEYRALRKQLTEAFGMPVPQLRQYEDQDLLVRRLITWMKGKPSV